MKDNKIMGTFALSDGTLVTIPLENSKETLEQMEKSLAEYKESLIKPKK